MSEPEEETVNLCTGKPGGSVSSGGSQGAADPANMSDADIIEELRQGHTDAQKAAAAWRDLWERRDSGAISTESYQCIEAELKEKGRLLNARAAKVQAEQSKRGLPYPMPTGEESVLARRTREVIAKMNPTTYQPYGSAENEANLISAMEKLAKLDTHSADFEQMQDTSIWDTEEMRYFNQLKKDAASFKGTLIELDSELKQGKLTQSNYNTLRNYSLRLAEETFDKMNAFLDQQAQRYVVAHPEKFFTKDKIAYIRTHPQEFPEFTRMRPEEEEPGKWNDWLDKGFWNAK